MGLQCWSEHWLSLKAFLPDILPLIFSSTGCFPSTDSQACVYYYNYTTGASQGENRLVSSGTGASMNRLKPCPPTAAFFSPFRDICSPLMSLRKPLRSLWGTPRCPRMQCENYSEGQKGKDTGSMPRVPWNVSVRQKGGCKRQQERNTSPFPHKPFFKSKSFFSAYFLSRGAKNRELRGRTQLNWQFPLILPSHYRLCPPMSFFWVPCPPGVAFREKSEGCSERQVSGKFCITDGKFSLNRTH